MNIFKSLIAGVMFAASTAVFAAAATEVTSEEGVATGGFKVVRINKYDFSIDFGSTLKQGYLTWSIVQNAYNAATKPTANASVSMWLDGVMLDSFANKKAYENSLTLATLTGKHLLQFQTGT